MNYERKAKNVGAFGTQLCNKVNQKSLAAANCETSENMNF
jgi:hypothetical protein